VRLLKKVRGEYTRGHFGRSAKKMARQTKVNIKTGTRVPNNVASEESFLPEISRDRPGLVELSRDDPTRGSDI
jgi:hypothetical protein